MQSRPRANTTQACESTTCRIRNKRLNYQEHIQKSVRPAAADSARGLGRMSPNGGPGLQPRYSVCGTVSRSWNNFVNKSVKFYLVFVNSQRNITECVLIMHQLTVHSESENDSCADSGSRLTVVARCHVPKDATGNYQTSGLLTEAYTLLPWQRQLQPAITSQHYDVDKITGKRPRSILQRSSRGNYSLASAD